MNRTEIEILKKHEKEAYIILLDMEEKLGFRDPLTEHARARWGVYYDLLDEFKIEPEYVGGVNNDGHKR